MSLITITIPVFERSDYFEEALNGALSQTVRCPIIVVDNGSSHNRFKSICEKYPDRVEYHKNATNIGMFPNWNLCYYYSNTEYTVLVGDDDIIDIHYVERFLEIRSQYPDIDLYYSNYKRLIEPSKAITPCLFKNVWGYTTMKKVQEFAVRTYLGLPSICAAVRTELMRKFPYETAVHGCNDWFSMYHLNQESKIFGDKEILYTYRKHQQSDTLRPEMDVILKLTQLLNLCDLAYLTNAPLYYKYKWITLFYFLYKENVTFIDKYLSTDSCYKKVFDMIKCTLIYKSSIVFVYVLLFEKIFKLFLKRICRRK